MGQGALGASAALPSAVEQIQAPGASLHPTTAPSGPAGLGWSFTQAWCRSCLSFPMYTWGHGKPGGSSQAEG